MKIAKKLKNVSDSFQGVAWLYELSPPMDQTNADGYISKEKFVIASACDVAFSGPETFVFACNAKGKIKSWTELAGSGRGLLDCDAAIRRAGYEVE